MCKTSMACVGQLAVSEIKQKNFNVHRCFQIIIFHEPPKPWKIKVLAT